MSKETEQLAGHILVAISPIDFILGAKVQPNRALSVTQVTMTLTKPKVKGQGENFPKMGKHILVVILFESGIKISM